MACFEGFIAGCIVWWLFWWFSVCWLFVDLDWWVGFWLWLWVSTLSYRLLQFVGCLFGLGVVGGYGLFGCGIWFGIGWVVVVLGCVFGFWFCFGFWFWFSGWC